MSGSFGEPVRIVRGSFTTGTVTDYDNYLPDGDAVFQTAGLREIVLITHRESETGTCTLDSFFELFNMIDNDWYPWLGTDASATQISGVQYANSAVDTSTPFYRYTVIKNGYFDGTDANRLETVNTVHKVVQAYFPPYIRVRFRTGGTSVANVFNAILSGN